jgi:hypothetical protein
VSPLARYQQGFAAALQAGHGPDDEPAGTPAWLARIVTMPGFAVYRNTVMKACVDALQANFPAVSRLVGEEWMRAAAARYAQAERPTGPMLLDYGATFPDFLAAFEPAASLPWLPAVATLDRLWIESHKAADAEPMDAAQLAAIEPSTLLDVRLRPHPSARWSSCAHSPAYTIWSRNRAEGECLEEGLEERREEDPLDWLPEGALLTRPHEVVLHRPLGPAGIAFLDACAAGATLGEATLAAVEAEPTAELPALIGSLLEAGALAQPAQYPDPYPDPNPDPAPNLAPHHAPTTT